MKKSGFKNVGATKVAPTGLRKSWHIGRGNWQNAAERQERRSIFPYHAA
jgi:hypothetical protein